MSTTSIGSGISPVGMASEAAVAPDTTGPESFDAASLIDSVRASLRHEMEAAVADIERRLAQARELERTAAFGGSRSVHTEDLNIGRHMIDGYTLTANSPANGSIAWSSLHIVLLGVDYLAVNGNTNLKYTWFVKPASGTSVTLQSSNTMPTLGANDALIFVNNVVGGLSYPISVLESSITYAVGAGVIGDAQISGGISQSKITNLSTALDSFTTDIQRVEAKADGAITQHFGPDFPWANASVQDPAKTGDVYTAQETTDPTNRPNGRSWKWSGANGSPANTWILITDSDLTKALADSAAARNLAMGKTTVYYRTAAQGAPPTPTDGFATGDEWVTTETGVRQRWNGTGWVTQLVYDSALASGISGAKIGAGILPSNLTGAGTAPLAAIPPITTAKLNTAFHMLY